MVYDFCKACRVKVPLCLTPDSHRAQGAHVWCCDFLLGGKPPKGERIRRMFASGVTKKEVEKFEHITIADYERGTFIPQDKAKVPFKDIVDKYFKECLLPKRRGDLATPLYYQRTINSLIGFMHIGTISLELLESIRTKFLEDTKASNATANRLFSVVKTIFNRAIEWGYIQVSPAKFLRDLPTQDTIPRFLTTEELARLWEQFKKDQRVYDYATALIHTGIRPIDLKGLEWSQVDLGRRTIQVTTYTGNKPRTYLTPIDDTLLGVLQRLVKESGGKGKVFNTQFRHQLIERMIKDSGINEGKSKRERFTFYGLKHCYISHLIMSGARIEEVSKLVNVSIATLQKHYAFLTQDHLREVQSRVNLTPQTKLQVI